MNFTDTNITVARDLDARDELREFRDHFVINDPDTIYLDGNSLGRLPRKTIEILKEAVEQQWGDRLIRGWNEGWIEASVRIGAKIAQIIGARTDEVIVADATSVNLFKLVIAALRDKTDRTKIISDELNFPSDLYILQGAIDLMGKHHELKLVPSNNGIAIDPEAIENAADENTALITLTHTCFKSAFVHDMARINKIAHEKGAYVLWDLSHSVGAVPVDLNGTGADLAVGCTYKYLNGGPGSPAFLYVRKDLQKKLMQPIWGWLGSEEPFVFNLDYKPAFDMIRFQVGSPPILSMLAIEPGLDIILRAGIEKLRKKSVMQGEYLLFLFHQWLAPLGFILGSPADPEKRGSHVSIRHPEAYRINRAMIEAKPPDIKVIPDFRTPDNIRLGIAPIYTSFEDIHRAMKRIKEIVEGKTYEQYSDKRHLVT
jgi:kynureninase